MRLARDGGALIIGNEVGGTYRIDLTSHLSQHLSGPDELAPATAPAKQKPGTHQVTGV